MPESSSFSASELVYLFLDGEADASERTALLAQLANDSALQREFQDALRMRLAVQAVAQRTGPPVVLTEQVFAAAGIVAAGAAAASVAHAASGAVSGGLLKGIVMIVSSAVVGSLITASVMRRPDTAPVPPSAKQSVVAEPSVSPVPASPTTAVSGGTESALPPAASRVRLSVMRLPASVEMRTDTSSRPTVPPPDDVMNWPTASTPSIGMIPVVYDTRPGSPIVAAPIIELRDAIRVPDTPEDEVGTVSMAVRGIASVRLFPDRPGSTSSLGLLGNAVLGALYRVTQHQSLGVEAGQENFPLYVQAADGTFTKQETLFWAGGVYRLTAEGIAAVRGVRPFAQILLGGTSSGPIGKSILGFEWQFDARTSMTVGAEGTLLIHQYQSVWSGAQKLGLTYGLAVRL